MLTLNIIGAGAVGQTLGYLLTKHRLVTLNAVLNQSVESSQSAIDFIGQGVPVRCMRELPPADLLLITVPDQHISAIVAELVTTMQPTQGMVVFHCSGALSSACLDSLHSKGCILASLHPCFSFKDPQRAVNLFKEIPCALEGDAAALPMITHLFTEIGALVFSIERENKSLYHAAAVFGSNYVITLAQQAHERLLEAGLSAEQSKRIVDSLLSSVTENVKQQSEPKLALTGPIQRGDMNTIYRHLAVLSDPVVRQFYLIMAHKTAMMANRHDRSAQIFLPI